MKKLFSAILILLSAVVYGQVESTITVPYTSSTTPTFQALLYKPSACNNPGTKCALLVCLHGAGESCPPLSNIYNNTQSGMVPYLIEHNLWPTDGGFINPKDGLKYYFIVVSPQSACNTWSTAGDQLNFIIQNLVTTYPVDTTRIYATGLSAGGAGVVEYSAHIVNNGNENQQGATRRWKFAAQVPMSVATITPIQSWGTQIAADGSASWGFGDPNNDVYGSTTQSLMQFINNAQSGLARFTGNPPFTFGHGGWNHFYDTSYKENFTWKGVTANMNIYEWMLINTNGTGASTSPTANAGNDQTISFPNTSVSLAGVGTAGTGHTISSRLWSYVSGPSGFTITSPNTDNTTVTGLVAGVYTFRYTVTNEVSAQASDDVVITVSSSSNTVGRQIVDSFPTNSSGSTITYGLTWLPPNYATSNPSTRRYPLIIALHGQGEVGSTKATLVNMTTTTPRSLSGRISDGWNATAINPLTGVRDSFIVVSPQAPSTSYNYNTIKFILPDILLRYRIDTTRIYLTGFSYGGDGAFTIIGSGDTTFLKKFAAIGIASTTGIDAVNGLTDVQVLANLRNVSTYKVGVWSLIGQNDNLYNLALQYHDSVNITLPTPRNKLTMISGATNSWNQAYDTTFRPNVNYYSASSNVTCHDGCATFTSPSSTTVPRGSGITQDSLNLFEWFLSKQRVFAVVTTPTASAGANQNIVLPTTTATLNGVGTPGSGHTIQSVTWTYVSGPSGYTITNPSSTTTSNLTTQITGLVLGTYVFRYTVTNEINVSAISDVTINVTANTYAPPVVTAGTDQTIGQPTTSVNVTSSATFTGAAQSSVTWKKFKTPGQPVQRLVVLGSSTSAGFGASIFDSSYVGRLTTFLLANGIVDSVIDLAVSGYNPYQAMPTGFVPSASVSAKLSPQDQPDPAHNITAALSHNPTHVLINFPTNGFDVLTIPEIMIPFQKFADTLTSLGITWYFTTTQPRADASFSSQTIQNYLQTVRDSLLNRFPGHVINFYDNMTIPGTTQRITAYEYGDFIHFNDLGHLQLFRQVVAANMFQNVATSSSVITNPNSQNTSITSLTDQGIHKFQVTYMDSHKQNNSSFVTITVNAVDAPTANAGSPQTITLPLDSVLLDGSASHSATSYQWTQLGGPNTAILRTPTTITTRAAGLIVGVYTFQLSVNSGVSISTVQITVNASASSCTGGAKYFIVPDPTDSSVFQDPASASIYRAGDTLVLYGNTGNAAKDTAFSRVDLGNLIGSPSCPIVVINPPNHKTFIQGTLVCDKCQYVKITGSGSGSQYGIFIQQDPVLRQQTFFGIEIKNRSKDIELERIYEHNVDLGMVIESNESCDTTVNYPNWVMDSILVHDCKIVGTWNEGIYYGNTSPDNASYDLRPVTCPIGVGGADSTIYPAPHKNGYTHIYNNIIDSTGRGGIQVANAAFGISEVNNNTVTHNGMNGDDAQGTAISLGLYTKAYVHDNIISNTYTWGIADLGAGKNDTVIRIENNTIDSSGYLRSYNLATTTRDSYNPNTEPLTAPQLTWPQAIEFDSRPRLYTTDTPKAGTAIKGKDSIQFIIKNNIIKLKKSTVAINIDDDFAGYQATGNFICSNVDGNGNPVTVNVAPNVNYSTNCTSPPPIQPSNGILRRTRGQKIKFVNGP